MPSSDPLSPALRRVVNKRLTLNTLIQGAAMHGCLSAHHLVADSLRELDPELLTLYDELSNRMSLAYWRGALSLINGRPERFWNRLDQPGNLFHFHPFMQAHGQRLAFLARDAAFERCKQSGISVNGLLNEVGATRAIWKTLEREKPHWAALERLACEVCHQIYAVPIDRLNASITLEPKWGDIRDPETRSGKLMMMVMVGWGGVDRRDGRLEVVGQAIVWLLVLHELIKGTIELICLHGMGQLDEATYAQTIGITEHVEHEVPMLQVGPELFRQFLAISPRELPLAQTLMHVAMLEPESLDEFMFDMVETPNRATERLRSIGRRN